MYNINYFAPLCHKVVFLCIPNRQFVVHIEECCLEGPKTTLLFVHLMGSQGSHGSQGFQVFS